MEDISEKMSLEEFLKERGVPEETIREMMAEKIDMEALKLMKDEELKKYLPAHGDRLAVKSFVNKSRRSSLIEKLRQSYDSFGGSNNHTDKRIRLSAKKQTRKIEIGWMIYDEIKNKFKHVRAPIGGNRKVEVQKTLKAVDIQKKAVELFFPEGASVYGSVEEFEMELLDYKSHKIVEAQTFNIEELYSRTGLTILRFYLAVKKKRSNEEDDEYRPISRTHGAKNDGLTYSLRPRSIQLQPKESNLDKLIDELNSLEDQLPGVSVGEYLSEFVADPQELALARTLEEPYFPPIQLILRRGHVFNDLLEAFKIHKDLANLEIEMILPNGKKEVGEDMGGVLRDALSEFWNTFYEKCTVGTVVKIPSLRDDFGQSEWEAVAKIIGMGWDEQKYVPVRISKVFIKHTLQIPVSDEDLISELLRYISEWEGDIIRKAMNDFNSVELEDILEILNNYDCRRVVNAGNFTVTLKGIAEKELLQKPEFISQCFANTHQIEKIVDLDEIYAKYEPTSRNILAKLETESPIASENQEKTFSFLKRFIREADSAQRSAFLRFCSGSDVVISNIKVSFNKSDGFTRMPVGHTCSCLLELPDTYPDFITFRSELGSILSSNIWIMDIV